MNVKFESDSVSEPPRHSIEPLVLTPTADVSNVFDQSSEASVSSSTSVDLNQRDERFNGGSLAVKLVTGLVIAYVGLRIHSAYSLARLLHQLQRLLDDLRPVLNLLPEPDQKKGRRVLTVLVLILSYSTVATITLSVCTLYVLYKRILRPRLKATSAYPERSRDQPSWARHTKNLLRAMGTALFYFVLLPEAIWALVLSGALADTGRVVDRQIMLGSRLSDEALQQLSARFDCEFGRPDGNRSCLLLDGANRTSVSKKLNCPLRAYLRKCHLPEAFSQMALIIIAFLVTHMVRSRGSWEVDHRELLESTAFQRLVEYRKSAGVLLNSQNVRASRIGLRRRKKFD